MKSFPILYKQAKTGATQSWQVFVKGNAFWTEAGQVGGVITKSKPTICLPKNEGRANALTAEEQAYAEAEAKWKKKRKAHYFENIKDIKTKLFTEPMLAEKYKDYDESDLQWPVMVDRKYNGMRQVTTIDGSKTRKGEPVHTTPHLFEAVQHLFKKHPNLVIDGECYNHEYRFHLNELIKLVRKSKHFTPEDLKASKEMVKYYVYDGYGFDNITEATRCSDRREALKKLFKGIPEIVVVDYEWAKNDEEVQKIYQEYVEDGYEGAIVRQDTSYEHKRTKALLKLKPTDDAEFEIVGIEDGVGNWTGAAKRILLRGDVTDAKGKVITPNAEFAAAFKGCFEDAVTCLAEKKKWIGKTVTIYYNGLTGKGIPNFAQFDYRNSLKGDR